MNPDQKSIEIEVIEDSDDYGDISQSLMIDGDEKLSVRSLYESPEDAIIGRDLVDCNDISNWIEYGYNKAREGYILTFK